MRSALLLALALAGCASVPDTDQAGNLYPPQCAGDLAWVSTPVVEASPADMAKLADGIHLGTQKRLWGYYSEALRIILIDKMLGGWKRADALRHERCHAIAGHWHK